MATSRSLGWWYGFARALVVGGCIVSLASRALAQITPDTTLGNEGSVVTPDVEVRGLPADLIEGGAVREANLFHSFDQFNVGEAQRVYFANPEGIENILGRVTGNNLSNIFGTLGVDGGASLFLLNPNGIIFGENARLDVAGSFVASTTNSLVFEDGLEFSATNPEAPPLLTVNLTPGLQYGENQPGATIANAGSLVVGQDLTLNADNLDLEGQLQAGGDLTLLATDTVRVRDSVVAPFVASAGGRLLVQGNQSIDIFALNHPQSGLFSGRDMILRSASQVGGDAHYWSGGSFRIERLDGSLGDLFSPYDPVVRANGDVAFASYTGASLHIFAGGQVFIPGTILITDTETGAADIDFINETITLSNGTSLAIDGSAYLTLDIRAGTIAFGSPFVNTGTPTSADITIGEIFTDAIFGDGGRVFLTNQYQPNPILSGEITVGAIDTSDVLGGGSITIDSSSGITLNSVVNVSAFPFLGIFFSDGGDINLLANGDITTNSDILAEGASGGDVRLTSRADIFLTNGTSIDTTGAASGNVWVQGRRVTLTDESSIVTATLGSQNGGETLIQALELNIEDDSVVVANTLGSGRGGNITLEAGQLSIQDGAQVGAATLGDGDTGDILIRADVVEVFETPDSNSSTAIAIGVDEGARGAAGNLIIEAERVSIRDGAQLVADTFGEGNAGRLQIRANDSVEISGVSAESGLPSFVVADVNAGATGTGGNLTIETQRLSIRNGAQVAVSTFGVGDAGNLTIRASESVEVSGQSPNGQIGSGLFAQSEPVGQGDGGDLNVETGLLIVRDGAQISASTFGAGNAGDLTVQAQEVRLIGDGSNDIITGLFAQTEAESEGDGGDLTIETGRLIIQGGAQVSTRSLGIGQGGNLSVTAFDSIELVGRSTDDRLPSSLFSRSQGFGTAGDLTITTERLIVRDGAQVSASTFGSGNAGDLIVRAAEVELIGTSVRGFSSGLFAQVNIAEGDGGDLIIESERLTVQGGAQVSASTSGSGNGGRLDITASEFIEVIGVASVGSAVSGLFTQANSAATGIAGDTRIATGQLIVRDGAQVSASTFGTGTAGSIVVQNADSVLLSNNGSISTAVDADAVVNASAADQGGNIDLQTRLLSLTNGAQVTASTSGQGDAGNILVRDAEEVLLSNSSISSAVSMVGAIGRGGSIEIQTASLSLDNSAQLSASTVGQGDTGRVAVQATDAITLANGSRISSAVEAGATGNSQQITLQTPTLSLTGDSQISAATSSTGNAGSIFVQNADSVSLESSSISTAVNEGAFAEQPSNIEIQTRSLLLTNGAQVTASTAGQGDAGSIFVREVEDVSLSDSAISTESSSAGIAGDVTLNTQQLTLQNDSEVSASTVSSQGGDITLQSLERLQVRNSLISASTETGTAGAVTVNATDSVQLSGAGGLSVEATAGGTAGDLSIETEQLTVQDGARVTVSSPSGQAGDLTISADSLRLNQGRLFAETGTSSAEGGANITLQGLDFLLLDNESLISATAFNQANGGNITIDSTFIVALPPEGPEGSDIIANADRGNGGRVSITTQGIYGIQFRPERTPDNDITVSSDFGVAGEFALTQPDIDPSRGLAQLPADLVDPTGLVDRSCAPGGAARTSSFTVTGRGGIPPSPTEPLNSEPFLTDWVTLDADEEDNTPPDPPTPSSAAPRQVVEAQGWVINAQGQVVLTAQAPTATPQPGWRPEIECSTDQAARAN